MSQDSVSLRDIYQAINELDHKIGSRIDRIELRTDKLESKVDVMAGKIGMFVLVGTLIASGVVSFFFDLFRQKQ